MIENKHITSEEVISDHFMDALLTDRVRLSHVLACRECQERLLVQAEYCEAEGSGEFQGGHQELDERVRQLIASSDLKPYGDVLDELWQGVLERLSPSHVVMAAADGQSVDQTLSHAASSKCELYFHADCERSSAHYWCAVMSIPVCKTEEAVLSIRFMDGDGNRISSGTFNFCGFKLRVEQGRGFLPLRDIVSQLKTPSASFMFSSGDEQEGKPVLFPPIQCGQ